MKNDPVLLLPGSNQGLRGDGSVVPKRLEESTDSNVQDQQNGMQV